MAPALLFPSLFEADVVTEEVAFEGDLDPLLEAEALALGRAGRKRALEYRAGRHAARRALAWLGVRDFALVNGTDRAPRWPAGIVGSITHTGSAERGLSVASVALSARVRSLGIDAEADTPLHPDLVSRIATSTEHAALAALDEAERLSRAKLLFCAKEAFYKCQYPLTRSLLDFEQAEVSVDEASCTLEVAFVAPCGEFPAGFRIAGRFRRAGGIVAVGMALR